MKLLVISHLFPRPNELTYGTFIRHWAYALKKQGVEIVIISPIPFSPFPINWFSKKWKRYSQIPEKIQIDGILIFYPRYLILPKEWLFKTNGIRMYYGIKKVVENIYSSFPFELIQAHVPFPDGYVGMLLKKRYNVPLVITNHSSPLFFKSAKTQKLIKRVFEHADGLTFVSTKIKNNALKFYFKPTKMFVIHNGIDPEFISMDKSFLDNRKYKNKRIILSVSRLVKTKGIDLNIYAISQLVKKYSNILYLIIGKGPESSNLKKLVKKLKLDDHIYFLGALHNQDVMHYMAQCDVFSLPSWSEGLGVVYLEAMAHAKPVIGCKGEGIEDIIIHNKNGFLVRPKNIKNLLEILEYCYLHQCESIKIGENARKVIFSNYTWTDAGIKFYNLYKNLINIRITKNQNTL